MDTNMDTNMNLKEFVCSSPTFNGFRCEIDMNFCENFEDIIKFFKEHLLEVLIKNNFDNLAHKIKGIKNNEINIKGYEFNDILLAGRGEIFFINILI